ncbi:MAG: RAMP superfamily CRISPR-associated protein [Planctomycetota bacterium]
MNRFFSINVILKLKGPLLSAGGELSDLFVDAPMSRDGLGRFMLPFSLIKGKVLDALRDLGAESLFLKKWFGAESDGGSVDPVRGKLSFADFYTEASGNPERTIHRNQINDQTGVVADGMLQMVQAPFGYEELVEFKGRITFISNQNDAENILVKLTEALHWVPSFGAFRSIGFGRNVEVQTDLIELSATAQGNPQPSIQIPLTLGLDRPVCVGRKRHSKNHFQSSTNISGAVIKGSIARLVLELEGSSSRYIDESVGKRFPLICKYFSKLRFAEARPRNSDQATRGIEPPLSIIFRPKGADRFFDVALAEEPVLIDGMAGLLKPDWKGKNYELVNQAFGNERLPTQNRTRTAIDEDTYQALDQQLFSYGLVLPEVKKQSEHIRYVWDSKIGIGDVPDDQQQAIRDELYQLLQFGIPNVGKTRAVASVKWQKQFLETAMQSGASAEKKLVVTLQTECLMTDPDILSQSTPDVIKKAYEDFWDSATKRKYRLVRFFARQSLEGGFVSRRSSPNGYEPFLLTDRGSVFVLQATDQFEQEKATQMLDGWLSDGLPIPDWVIARYGGDEETLWKRCPYLPQVGFGAVLVNLDCHWKNSSVAQVTAGESK